MLNERQARRLIAISGKSGCGNSTVSRLVAEELGYQMVNFTFRSLARARGAAFEAIRRRAEVDDSVDREVDRHQVELALVRDSVLGSRLAIWMAPYADLRVYLYADSRIRSQRVWKREGGPFSAAQAHTEERDRLDRDRYLRIYGIDIDRYHELRHLMIVDVTDMRPTEISCAIAAEFLARVGSPPLGAEKVATGA